MTRNTLKLHHSEFRLYHPMRGLQDPEVCLTQKLYSVEKPHQSQVVPSETQMNTVNKENIWQPDVPLPDLRRRNNESKKLHLKEAQNNVLIEYTEPHREKSMSTKQNGANRKKKENNNREDRQYPGQDGAEKALRQPRHSQSVKVQHQHHNDK